MKRYSSQILLASAAVVFLSHFAVAQTAKPSPYEGLSEPPSSDAIVATPDTPAATVVAAPAPTVARPTVIVLSAAPSGAPTIAAPSNPDGDIVNVAPSTTATANTRPSTLEPTLYERSTNPDADIVQVAPLRPGELDTGTLIRVRLQEALSTSNNAPGDAFTAIAMAPVSQSGKVIIPMGAEIKGRIVSVHEGKSLGRKATMHLRPDTVTMPDGSRYMLHAQVVQTEGTDTKAVSEGTITTKSHLKRDAIQYGVATGSGAVLGAAVAGGTGALVGTAIGAGLISVHLLLQNHQALLPKDSVLIFGLTEPMTLIAVQN